MDGKIDKTRRPREGKRSFTGTGVGSRPEAVGENIDLAQYIQDLVAEAMATLTTGDITTTPARVDDVTITNIVGGITRQEVINIVNEHVDDILNLINEVRLDIFGRFGMVWDEFGRMWASINTLVSGVAVFRYASAVSGKDGRYLCLKVRWNGSSWTAVNTNDLIICQNVTETDGHAFTVGQLFIAVATGKSEGGSGIVWPVSPLILGTVHATVKETPAAGSHSVTARLLSNGETITVLCTVIGGSGNETLDEAEPQLKSGDPIRVFLAPSTEGNWRNATTLHSIYGGGGWMRIVTVGESDLQCIPLDGDLGDIGTEEVSVGIHPESIVDNYKATQKIYASKVGGIRTSVNFFSDAIEFVGNQLDKCEE